MKKTVIVDHDANELQLFKRNLQSDTVLFSDYDGFTDFMATNSNDISTVIFDSDTDLPYTSIMVQFIKSLFPAINIIEYTSNRPKCIPLVDMFITKPFDGYDLQKMRSLIGATT